MSMVDSYTPDASKATEDEVARVLQRLDVPGGLTSREVEVLRLIVKGKSNPQIADELFISAKTVGNHVSNILNKTDSSSRSEAAAYAVRQGIA